MKGAQDYVEYHPGERKPARPVVASKHKRSTNDRYQLDEFHPKPVVLKGALCVVLPQVVNEADCTHAYIHKPEDRYREGTRLIHGNSSPSPGSAPASPY